MDDDRPYYYQQEPSLLTSHAGGLLVRILKWLSLGAVLLVLLPLIGRRAAPGPRVTPALLYFSALGAGFMFVEIGLMQQLALYLGHPAYSVAVTLPSMLLFSGVGSLSAGRFFVPSRRPSPLPFAMIAVLALGYAFALHAVLVHLTVASHALRCAIVVVLLAPASFFQGMPFPMMLRRLGQSSAPLVPWAYAVNSVTSVIASVVAVLVAMAGGFHIVLMMGAGCYLLALVLATWPLGGEGLAKAGGGVTSPRAEAPGAAS